MAISLVDSTPELAKYELAEQIGHGGMATVYRARDKRLGRDVAVKLIHPHLRESVEVAARFVSEARAVAMLKHPNIVEVYDISEEQERERYLVVELIRGLTLRDLLKKHPRVPPEIAAIIGIRLAAALAHAHSLGIIHRDVKPENVLIEVPRERVSRPEVSNLGETEHANIKLTDFGIAKLLDAQGVTSTGQVLGSPAHMAPEQIEGGPVGPTADVFGLGVLLYECVTGQLPFDGKNPAQVLRRVLDGTFTPADRVLPEVGAGFAAVLSRALAKESGQRFASTDELAESLRGQLVDVGFENETVELDEYIADPEGYAQAFRERIATALGEAGLRARARGQAVVAGQHFNRALAYCPGDPELLRCVSSIARRDRWRRGLGIGVASVALVAAAAAAWVLRPATDPKPVTVAAPELPQPTHTAGAAAEPESPPVPAVSAPSAPAPAAEAPPAARPRRRPPPRLGAQVPERPVVRKVRVTPSAKGGTVAIDGTEYEWFGRQIELAVGEHTFEFKPRDPECCVTTAERRVIEEGDGIQNVFLDVKFRPATLEFRVGALGAGRVECAEFFPGSKRLPAVRSVQIVPSTHETRGTCVFTPDDPNVSETRQQHVTLRAGEKTTWP